MVALTCYLDDSGTHTGSLHVVAGGLLGRDDVWPDFEERWRAALSQAQISHWHSKEAQHFTGQFEGKDEAFRRNARGATPSGHQRNPRSREHSRGSPAHALG